MTREQLEDAVFDAYPTVDMSIIESFSDDELRHLLAKDQPAKQAKPVRVKEQVTKPTIERVEGLSLDEAFEVSHGRLMRRIVTRHTLGQFAHETVHLAPLGERVRFDGRVYRVSHLLHYFKTGELVNRLPRAAKPQRYKAQVRVGARVVHLGYFVSKVERDAAVFAYRLGITPSK